MPEKEIINPYELLKNSVAERLKVVDQIILDVAKSKVELVPQIVNHLTQSGGKRIRPILTLACAQIIGCTNPDICKLAAAVEFIHTATLFHDDVIDESEMRRGQKTASNIWGNKASILIGDFLLSHAFKLMTDTRSLEALSLLSDTSITITESEVWQLDLIGNIDISIENYMELIHGKTASLFAASCAVSGHLAENLDPNIQTSLYEFGRILGILFQISDDYLDYYASQSEFGKVIGSDFCEKKITLPLILLLQSVSQTEREIISQEMEKNDPNVETIITMMDKYSIKSKTLNVASQYSNEAKIMIKSLPNHNNKILLADLVDFIMLRTK